MELFGIMFWVLNLFVMYLVVRNAIDNSRNTELLRQNQQVLRDIRKLLEEQKSVTSQQPVNAGDLDDNEPAKA